MEIQCRIFVIKKLSKMHPPTVLMSALMKYLRVKKKMLCESKETKVIDKNPPGAADCSNMGSRE